MKYLVWASFLATAALLPTIATAEKTSAELEQELEKLKSENKRLSEKFDIVMEDVEKLSADNTLGAGATDQLASKVVVGGYGELHYNNLQNQLPNGENIKEIDFHRFVLFFGYDFTDSIRFFSELELEHALAGEDQNGEIELEQAYLEFDVNKQTSVMAGLFLVPVGILNETHEPTTFYGVERNPIEKNIIPSTWWECGAAVGGRFGAGFSYDVTVTSGLNASAADNYKVRDGRQKCSEAKADDLAYTTRLKWTAIPGLELAASVQHQTNITQSTDASAGAANLLETHVAWQYSDFGLRALYSAWRINGSGPRAVGANKQLGWYVEPSWKFHHQVGIFVRHNNWDNQAGNSTDSETTQWNIGVNYWPHPDAVIKFDYQDQSAPAGNNEFDGFNLGVGYQF